MNKSIWTLIGFVFFAIGILSIVLALVGVKLSYLLWMDSFGSLWSFILKLVMIVMGGIIMVASRSDFSGESDVMV